MDYRSRPKEERNYLCGELDPEHGVECLLAEGHVQLRQTKHRGVFRMSPGTRRGTQVMWGEGREVWQP